MKRILLLFTLALFMATVVIVSAPAYAAKPHPLAITILSPGPGDTDVALSPGRVVVFLDPFLDSDNLARKVRLTNVNTGEDVTPLDIGYNFPELSITTPGTTFECGTTYEVSLIRLKSLAGGKLSEAPEGVTLKGGVATWTFTTVDC